MMPGYLYTGCGLDYVYLINGYHLHDTEYGQGVSIDDADGLHRTIAREVVTRRQRLRGQEVRFLRALLDLSQGALARKLGTTRASVARWEAKPHTAIPQSADRLLRVLHAQTDGPDLVLQVLDLLEEMDELAGSAALFEETEGRWASRRAA